MEMTERWSSGSSETTKAAFRFPSPLPRVQAYAFFLGSVMCPALSPWLPKYECASVEAESPSILYRDFLFKKEQEPESPMSKLWKGWISHSVPWAAQQLADILCMFHADGPWLHAKDEAGLDGSKLMMSLGLLGALNLLRQVQVQDVWKNFKEDVPGPKGPRMMDPRWSDE